jgi:hypothetical protein
VKTSFLLAVEFFVSLRLSPSGAVYGSVRLVTVDANERQQRGNAGTSPSAAWRTNHVPRCLSQVPPSGVQRYLRRAAGNLRRGLGRELCRSRCAMN